MKTRINANIKWIIMQKLCGALPASISVIIAPAVMDANKLGYFFVFLTIVNLVFVFESGIGAVLTNFLSYENIRNEKKYRFKSIIKESKKYFSIVSLLYLLIGIIYSIYVFKDGKLGIIEWILPCTLLIYSTSLLLKNYYYYSLSDVLVSVANTAKIRVSLILIPNIFLIIFLLMGYELNSFIFSSIASIAITMYCFNKVSKQLNYKIYSNENNNKINNYEIFEWKKEILPLQWKMMVTWIAGYLTASAIIPISFIKFGAETTGKLGLLINATSAIVSFGLIYLNTISPKMGGLIARGKNKHLDNITKVSLIKGISLSIILCLFFIIIVEILKLKNIFLEKFFNIEINAVMILWAGISVHAAGMATYMRSFKIEPLMMQSVLTGLITVITLFYLGDYSLELLVFGYTLVQFTFGFIYINIIYFKFKRQLNV
jgi:hypothetical protein